MAKISGILEELAKRLCGAAQVKVTLLILRSFSTIVDTKDSINKGSLSFPNAILFNKEKVDCTNGGLL
ncbi:MAG TPA: hypothetical protein HA346_02020 [Thermoplasmata archaeon]|nr:hypothetical protein [Thermoplasmata archaeon]HIH97773.1 hypothetical protein [Thermoplasmata archaeon]